MRGAYAHHTAHFETARRESTRKLREEHATHTQAHSRASTRLSSIRASPCVRHPARSDPARSDPARSDPVRSDPARSDPARKLALPRADTPPRARHRRSQKRWQLYDRPDGKTNPGCDKTTEFSRLELADPIDEFWLEPGDLMYFPRGTVHQAHAHETTHSLHLTFSTYQRHTWRHLLDRIPSLSARAKATIAKLVTKRRSGLLRDLPLDVLDAQPVGDLDAAWRHCAEHLIQPHLPMWLTRELWADNVLGEALDQLAVQYLLDCLPPVGSAPLTPGTTELDETMRLRPFAPRCARLVTEAAATGCLDQWERGEGEVPRLVLYTNVGNGRAFSDPPSPRFEVLPALARSVLEVLRAGEGGVEVASLSAAKGATFDDLLDLLELLVDQGILIVVKLPKRKRPRAKPAAMS